MRTFLLIFVFLFLLFPVSALSAEIPNSSIISFSVTDGLLYVYDGSTYYVGSSADYFSVLENYLSFSYIVDSGNNIIGFTADSSPYNTVFGRFLRQLHWICSFLLGLMSAALIYFTWRN